MPRLSKKANCGFCTLLPEQDNNKAQGKQERRFAILEDNPVEEFDGKLHINFTYELHPRKIKQTAFEPTILEFQLLIGFIKPFLDFTLGDGFA